MLFVCIMLLFLPLISANALSLFIDTTTSRQIHLPTHRFEHSGPGRLLADKREKTFFSLFFPMPRLMGGGEDGGVVYDAESLIERDKIIMVKKAH